MPLLKQTEAGTKIHLAFMFSSDNVGLRFEADVGPQRDKQLASKRLHTVPLSAAVIVVIVDNLAECLHRIRDHGFHVYVSEVEANAWVKAACAIDPNGVRVRLLESDLFRFSAGNKAHGRLAYVTVPAREYAAIDKAVEFYDLFVKPVAHSSHIKKAIESKWESGARRADNAFRMVDMERFVEDLTTYCWFANGNRKRHAALCLQHRLVRREQSSTDSTSTDDAKLGSRQSAPASTLTALSSLSQAQTVILSEPPSPHAALPSGKSLDDLPSAAAGGTVGVTPVAGTATEFDKISSSVGPDSFGLSPPTAARSLPANSSSRIAPGSAQSTGSHSSVESDKQASAAQQQQQQKKGATAEEVFLGVSFLVSDLEYIVKLLKDRQAVADSRLEIQHVPGLARFLYFFDPALVPIEITDGVLSSSLHAPGGSGVGGHHHVGAGAHKPAVLAVASHNSRHVPSSAVLPTHTHAATLAGAHAAAAAALSAQASSAKPAAGAERKSAAAHASSSARRH